MPNCIRLSELIRADDSIIDDDENDDEDCDRQF